MARCERMKKPMSIVMVDVRHFKKYNDTTASGGRRMPEVCGASGACRLARVIWGALRRRGIWCWCLAKHDGRREMGSEQHRQHVADLICRIAHPTSAVVSVAALLGIAAEGQEFETLLNSLTSSVQGQGARTHYGGWRSNSTDMRYVGVRDSYCDAVFFLG